MGLILTPVIILACLLRADSHVTTTHLTKGQRRKKEGETAISPCPSVSLLIFVISDDTDFTSLVTSVHHQPPAPAPIADTGTPPLLSCLVYSLTSLCLLPLLKFLLSFVSRYINLTSSPFMKLESLSFN